MELPFSAESARNTKPRPIQCWISQGLTVREGFSCLQPAPERVLTTADHSVKRNVGYSPC